MTSRAPTAALLIIGNEILSGRTQDSNLNVLARKLGALGIKLVEARVVPDEEAAIVAAVNALRERATYVFTTGGIGPTHDDITVASIAKAFNVPVVEDAEARARLTAYYTFEKLNPARLRMALVPQGASLIDNPVSTAPGFHLGNVYALAGVPSVMEAMLDSLLADLKHGPALHTTTISCAVPESMIADGLAAIATRFPQLDIGSYPTFRPGKIGLALVTRGTDKPAVTAATADICALVMAQGGEPTVV